MTRNVRLWLPPASLVLIVAVIFLVPAKGVDPWKIASIVTAGLLLVSHVVEWIIARRRLKAQRFVIDRIDEVARTIETNRAQPRRVEYGDPEVDYLSRLDDIAMSIAEIRRLANSLSDDSIHLTYNPLAQGLQSQDRTPFDAPLTARHRGTNRKKAAFASPRGNVSSPRKAPI